MSGLRRLLVLLLLVFLGVQAADAQTTYYWRNPEATNGLWSGSSGSGANWWRGFAETPTGSEILVIDNDNQLSMVNDLAATSRFQLIFTNSIASHTVFGTSTNTFYDFGGTAPKIENYSTSMQTLFFPIEVGNNVGGGLQINPVYGDMKIGGELNLLAGNAVVYSGNQGSGLGKMLTLSGTVYGTNKLIINADAKVKVTGTASYTGNTEINKGEFWLGSGGTISNGSTIFIGNGGALADVAKVWIEAAGGILSNSISVNAGNTGTRFLGGLNASGSAIYAGNITLSGGGVIVTNTSGGSVLLSGTVDLQGNTATFSSPGNVTVSGSINGTGTFSKFGSGTLFLTGTNNFSGATITFNGGVANNSANNGNIRLSNSLALGPQTTTKTIDMFNSTSSGLGAVELAGGITVSNKNFSIGGRTASASAAFLRNISGSNVWAGNVSINNSGGGYSVDSQSGGTLVISGTILNTISGGSRGLAVYGGGTTIFNGRITNGGATALTAVTKNDNGTLYLTGTNTFTGGLILNGGTTFIGATSALSTNNGLTIGGSTVLDLGGNAQGFASISLPTRAVTARFTNGSIRIAGTGGFSFTPTNGTAANASTLDFSGLTAFTYTNAAGTFEVNSGGGAIAGVRATNTILLARTGLSTNSITAANVQVGALGNKFAGGDGTSLGRLLLGSNNTINANFINVGGYQASGLIAFQSGITNGTLTLRSASGTGRLTTLMLNDNNSGSNPSGTIDLTGGSLDLLATNVVIGAYGVGTTIGTLIMPTGTLDTFNLMLAVKTNQGASAITGVLTQGGGLVLASNIIMGSTMATNGLLPNLTATYNLNGGVLQAASIQTSGTGTFGAASARTINFNSGTIRTYNATSDLLIQGTNGAGGLINIVLGTASNHTFFADAGRSITVAPTATISGSGAGGLTKDGTGNLVLNGTNTYSGETRVVAGAIILGNANGMQLSTLNLTNSDAGVVSVVSPLNAITIGGLAGSRNWRLTNSTGSAFTVSLGGNNGSTEYSGSLSGGGVTKQGIGAFTLSGTNNVTGLRVERGTVNVTGATNNISGVLTVGTDNTAANASTLNWSSFGVLSGGANSRIGDGNQGTATQTMNIVSGTLLFTNAGARFSVGAKQLGILNITNGAFVMAPNSQTLQIGSDISFGDKRATGFVNVSGAGVLSYLGTSGFIIGGGTNAAGGTNVSGGTGFLNIRNGGVVETASAITNSAGVGSIFFDGGTLRALTNLSEMLSLNGTAVVSTNGVSVDSGVYTVTMSEALQHDSALGGTPDGGLDKLGTGTLILTGNNTYTGATLLSNGTLQVGNGGASGSLGTGSVSNLGTLVFNRSGSTSVGAVSGTGTVTVLGGGTVGFTGSNTYTGDTFVNAGTAVLGAGQASSDILLGDTSGSAGAGFLVNAGVTNGAAVTVRAGSSGLKVLGGTNTSGTATFTNTVTLNTAATVTNAAGGAVLFTSAVRLDTNVLSVSGAGAATLSGSLSSTGAGSGINKAGSGALTLGTANTFTNAFLTVQQGGVILGNVGALSGVTNATVASGARLEIRGFGSGNINTTPVNISGNGGGANGGQEGALVFANGGADSYTWGSAITLNGDATIGAYGVSETITFTNLITGTGDLTFSGRGGSSASHNSTFILNNTNTYVGDLVIRNNDGLQNTTVRLGVNNALHTNGTVSFTFANTNAGAGPVATLDLNGKSQQIAGLVGTANVFHTNHVINSSGTLANLQIFNTSNITASARIGGGAANNNIALTKLGTNTLTLAVNNTYSGPTLVNDGTLQVGAGGASGSLGTGVVTNNGVLAFNRSDSVVVANALRGAGDVLQNGAGTTILTGANSYSGDTYVASGTLQVGNGAASGTLGTGTVYNDSVLAFDRSDNVTVGNLLTGTGRVEQNGAGTTIFTNGNDYTGVTLVQNGSLQIGDGGNTGSLGSGNVTNNATLSFNRNDAITVGNLIAGTGTVMQAGTGSTTLTNLNTYSGDTIVSNGTLYVNNVASLVDSGTGSGTVRVLTNGTLGGSGSINGEAIIDGRLTPGNSPGILTFNSNLTFSTTSELVIEINGTNVGTQYDQVLMGNAGILTFNGNPTLTINDTMLFASNTVFNIIANYGSVVGTFNGLAEGAYVYGLMNSYVISYGGLVANTVTLAAVPEPGSVVALLAAGGALVSRRRRRR